MPLVDTHCHIHSEDYPLEVTAVLKNAAAADVTRLICVGTTAEDSELAVQFAASHDSCWASIGLHPHDAKMGEEAFATLRRLANSTSDTTRTDNSSAGDLEAKASQTPAEKVAVPIAVDPGRLTVTGSEVTSLQRTALDSPTPNALSEQSEAVHEEFGGQVASATDAQTPSKEKSTSKLVAVGECGLDYFYNHSSKEDQVRALRMQIELALEHNLPMIFHVREAFDDFWPIFDSYKGIRGVLHSFTDNRGNFDEAMNRGLHIGVNGIMTFTKNDWQLEIVKTIPSNRLLLETDAPFLTPTPLRGNINEPANVSHVCRFVSQLRKESAEELARSSTQNAIDLFAL